MKVRELIDTLMNMEQDAEVFICKSDWTYTEDFEVYQMHSGYDENENPLYEVVIEE